MDSNYYKEYFELERQHWWFVARAAILRSQIARLNPATRLKILNVGAATGATTEMLSAFGEVTSVEYDLHCCEFLRKELKMEVIHASVTELPFANDSFDLVCAFDVVEHVEDDKEATRELRRVCKRQGLVMCTVPAFNFLWSDHDTVNHHVRRYTSKSFKNLFPEAETIVFSSYFNSLLFLPVSIFRLLTRVFKNKSKIIRQGSGSDFSISMFNWVEPFFLRIFLIENTWLKRGIPAPIGISYLLAWKKPSA
ncbi:MAG: hypothetical protein RLZZ630_1128 [Bacteroidota bacterium]|jgi:ubiquinone/menaquinone biosynthesis C-methylase UbiE